MNARLLRLIVGIGSQVFLVLLMAMMTALLWLADSITLGQFLYRCSLLVVVPVAAGIVGYHKGRKELEVAMKYSAMALAAVVFFVGLMAFSSGRTRDRSPRETDIAPPVPIQQEPAKPGEKPHETA